MKVGITGHRNQRLGLPEDETDEKWTPIQFWIIDELSKFIKTCADNNEPLDLYTGMAWGLMKSMIYTFCDCGNEFVEALDNM